MRNPYKKLTNDPHNNNTLYEGIMNGYKDVVDVSTGMLHSQNGMRSSGRIDGSFEHIPAEYVEGTFRKLLKLNPNPTFLDLGSGLGNIVKLTNALGYKACGVEKNNELKKWNEGLDITWGDFFDLGELMSNKDIIYMYRPLYSGKNMDKLLQHIIDNSSDNVLIFYKCSHLRRTTGSRRKSKKYNAYHDTDSFGERSFIFKDKSYYTKLYEIGLIPNEEYKYKAQP